MMKIVHSTPLYLLITGLTFALADVTVNQSIVSYSFIGFEPSVPLCISVSNVESGGPVQLSVDYFDCRLNLNMTYGIQFRSDCRNVSSKIFWELHPSQLLPMQIQLQNSDFCMDATIGRYTFLNA